MQAKITAISPDSPITKKVIVPGDILVKINKNEVHDILDYMYYSYDRRLTLELTGKGGKPKYVRVRKEEGEDLGLEFQDPLMDEQRSCKNKCIFCFIDQMPEGMRETLYYKDDDVRLSFLQGNYVTLTNLSEQDIDRLIELHISPINVSVHTLNPKLRQMMLGRSFDKGCSNPIDHIERLANAGITLNCQIVCCPGINDGSKLSETIEGLIKLGKSINSVSIVPVGLTSHRDGLYKLKPFNEGKAKDTVRKVEKYGEKCLEQRDSRVFYCADELYMMAGFELPPDEFYEDYPQLENGVGMMRLFITEFMSEMEFYERDREISRFSKDAEEYFTTIVTGTLAAPELKKLLYAAEEKYGKLYCKVQPIENRFFGEGVTVSGLITGRDIIKQLQGKSIGRRLLIPRNMLRSGDEVFLDDITVEELSIKLKITVEVVETDGAMFFQAIMAE